MATRILRLGNTLTVEIPAELVAEAALPVGDPIECVANGDGAASLLKQVDRPANAHYRRTTLEEIIEGVPEGTSLGEVDWGQPRGAEVW